MDEQEPFDTTQDKQQNTVSNEPFDTVQDNQQEVNQLKPTPQSPPPSHKKLIIGIVAVLVLVVVTVAWIMLVLQPLTQPIDDIPFDTKNTKQLSDEINENFSEGFKDLKESPVMSGVWEVIIDGESKKLYRNVSLGFEIIIPDDWTYRVDATGVVFNHILDNENIEPSKLYSERLSIYIIMQPLQSVYEEELEYSYISEEDEKIQIDGKEAIIFGGGFEGLRSDNVYFEKDSQSTYGVSIIPYQPCVDEYCNKRTYPEDSPKRLYDVLSTFKFIEPQVSDESSFDKIKTELGNNVFDIDNYPESVNLTYSASDLGKELRTQLKEQITIFDKEISQRTDLEQEDLVDLIVIMDTPKIYVDDSKILYLMTPGGYGCYFGGLSSLIEGCEYSKLKLFDTETELAVTVAEDDFINAGTEETADIWPYNLGDVWYFQKENTLLLLGSGKHFGEYILYNLENDLKFEGKTQFTGDIE